MTESFFCRNHQLKSQKRINISKCDLANLPWICLLYTSDAADE